MQENTKSIQREIKFRAWDKEREGMVSEFVGPYEFIWTGFYRVQDGQGLTLYDKNDVVLMQYTGIKDKNGKEIYEGDIVRVDEITNYYPERRGVVAFKWGTFLLENRSGDAIEFWNDGSWPHSSFEEISDSESCLEIIGNIYENPELLDIDNSKKGGVRNV